VTETDKALEMARQAGLDLIEIAPNIQPPVCKIMDFGKYLYQQQKKEHQQKTRQKTIEVKSIRLSLNIGVHDMEVKIKQAEKFLNQGNKLRVDVVLRGREKAHPELAYEKIKQFVKMIPFEIQIDQPAKREFRGISTVVSKK